MAEWQELALPVATGRDVSPYVSDIELTNLMLVRNPPGSRKPFHIKSTPTLASASTPTTGVIRGVKRRKDTGTTYIVQGTTLYSGNLSSWTSQGTMPGTALCRMVDTGTHMVIVDGTNARAYNYATDTVQTPSIEGFIDVAYQDGYTIYAKAESNRLYVSSLDDPTTIGALDFTTVDALGGVLVGVMSVGRELFAFKTGSIEYFYNAGGSGFPFVRSSPGLIETTCWPPSYATVAELRLGAHGIQEIDGVIYWVGSDRRVYAMRGHTVTPISTPWIERFIRNTYASDDQVYGSVYAQDGSSFYILDGDYSGTKASLVYEINTGLWHKRNSSYGSTYYTTHAFHSDSGDVGVVVRSGSESGVYTLNPDGTNDAGASALLSRAMTLPQLDFGERRAFMPELVLDMQKLTDGGTALTQSITATWSDDGGTTYSSGISNSGFNARTRFLRLGSFLKRIVRITFAQDNRLAVMGVRAKIEVGQ